MKYILLIFAFTYSFSFAQEKQFFDSNWKKTDKENASYYRLTKTLPNNLFLLKDYFINGSLQMEGSSLSKNVAIFEGKVTWYDNKGVIKNSKTYSNGVLDGEIIEYENGKINKSGFYNNSLKNAVWKYFYPNGNILKIIHYNNGSIIGDYVNYNEKGDELVRINLDKINFKLKKSFLESEKFLLEGNFTNGKRDGIWKSYNDKHLVSINKFKDDKKVGVWKKYKNKHLYASGFYKNDKKNGVWKKYNDTNYNLEVLVTYKNDKKNGHWKRYFINGILKEKGRLKNNLKDGKWKIYDKKGNLKHIKYYKKGKLLKKKSTF